MRADLQGRVASLGVEERPEWTNRGFGSSYRLTVRVIGGRLLLCQPTGYGTLSDCEAALELTDEVAREAFGPGRTYVQIEDYRTLQGASFEARRHFIECMRSRDNLAGLVFCGASPLLRLSVRLGAKLIMSRTPVKLVETLDQATDTALALLGGGTAAEASPRGCADLESERPVAPDGHGPPQTWSVRSEAGWALRMPGFSSDFELIGGRVLHAVSSGYLEPQHVDALIGMNEQLAARLEAGPNDFSLVLGLDAVRGASRAGRRRYVEEMRAWHRIRPFRMLVCYGVNRALEAAIMISRPFVPFKVRVAKDLARALELVWTEHSGQRSSPTVADESALPDELRPEVDALLAFLGNLDWDGGEQDGLEEPPKAAGPLAPLFDALYLIRSDVAGMIEARAKAESELLVEKAYFEQLFETAQLAIVVATADGLIQRVNSEFSRLFGYSPEESVGRCVDDLVAPPELREEARQMTATAAAGTRIARERARCRKDGSRLHALVLGSPVVVGSQQVAVFAIYQDVTERVVAERALAASEERYRTIVESLVDGYYEADLEDRVTFCNPTCARIFGRPREEVVGRSFAELLGAEAAANVRAALAAAVRSGRTETTPSFALMSAERSAVEVETAVAPIRRDDERVAGFRGTLRDVTARVTAEREREQLEARLEQAQRLEAIGTLAGGIAHNFNNLLTGILGNVELLRYDGDLLAPRAEERLVTLERLVESGASLTRQLLGYARGGRIEVRAIDLNAIIRETVDALGGTRREICFQCELDPALPPIRADRVQVEQILLNLLINAIDAMSAGGEVTVTTSTVSHHCLGDRAYQPAPGRYVRLAVRDTGVGMDEATQRRVFEPFFTTKGLGKGTGLGLSSVFGIVKGHAGYIDLESAPGVGTTFEVFLPAAGDAQVEDVERRADTSSGSGTVLLVDDEPGVLSVLAAGLMKIGYRVISAAGGRPALELLSVHRDEVDVVVLDMVMPDLGGREVFDRLREIDRGVRVVLASGYAADDAIERMLEDPHCGFIQKPFTMAELSRTIERVLE